MSVHFQPTGQTVFLETESFPYSSVAYKVFNLDSGPNVDAQKTSLLGVDSTSAHFRFGGWGRSPVGEVGRARARSRIDAVLKENFPIRLGKRFLTSSHLL